LAGKQARCLRRQIDGGEPQRAAALGSDSDVRLSRCGRG
jgi:hypothetical protein